MAWHANSMLWLLQELHPAYLEHYYTTAPAGAGSSWMQLDAAAEGTPGFTRFTSPSLHVRAFSSSASTVQRERCAHTGLMGATDPA